MSNLKTPALTVGAITLLVAGGTLVYACGPFFPMQLLDNRAATLFGTPSNSFAYEAAHLVTPDNALKLPAQKIDGGDNGVIDTTKVLEQGLSAQQVALLRRMADAADGDAAYALGASVPEGQRLEAAARVDLKLADQPCDAEAASATSAASSTTPAATGETAPPKKITCPDPAVATQRAAARLDAVLALPPAQSAQVGLIAADELAQLASAQALQCGVGASCATSLRAAHDAFVRVRVFALRGAPDPLGIAVSSYGDEALLDLRNATHGDACNWLSFVNATPCAAAIPAAGLKHAIGLYAQQAARGTNTGVESLTFIADWALADARRAGALIDDPVSQHLLVSFALARVGDIENGDPASANDYRGGWDTTVGPSGYNDAARGGRKTTANPRLAALVEAIRARGLTHIGRADQLAALAYRIGRYDLASKLLAGQNSALANWVRAKLALRHGDTDGALRAYAAASQAFPANDTSVEPTGTLLVEGERGVLTLARGQYVEALGLFYSAVQKSETIPPYDINYAGDMAYVAERVLTTDELKTFVDAHASASKSPAPGADPNAQTAPVTTGDTLRYLLARRLVRDGRIDEALPYFPQDGDPRYQSVTYDAKGQSQVHPNAFRALTQRYGAVLHTAQHGWFRTTRAQAWFDAATLARRNGMELMGYEQDPDYTDVGGSYAGGSGRDRVDAFGDDANPDANPPPPVDNPVARAQAALRGPFVTDGEKARYAASESKPYMRYHYRSIAADDVQHAADLLPPRSQAYAAVLCQGAAWTLNDDPVRARHFYQQYVERGAYVDFGGGPFGTRCAAPDFHAAKYFRLTQTKHTVLRFVRAHHKRVALTGAGVLLLIAGGAVWGYRRRAKNVPSANQGKE
ncbi:hypothetical protein [Paraburkholderia adhaesiva]|uniref:hypothetical protein n=1 Tax=Paraburkholderia adhaesiva TaxID=2883244 RepID=UPI001F39B39C|nr:hypothetical protein [Paraburkholderia adhaesiva]